MSIVMYFLTFLITKTSSDQFGVYPLAKIILYFDTFHDRQLEI